DFNARSTAWDIISNKKGLDTLNFITAHNLSICNQIGPITFSNGYSSSAIDLCLLGLRSNLVVKSWKALSDGYHSDHLPILIKLKNNDSGLLGQRQNIKTFINDPSLNACLVEELTRNDS